jgi:iron complex transport system ATP-binding protein
MTSTAGTGARAGAAGLVEFRQVGFAYPAARRGGPAPFRVRDVTFDVAAGAVVGIIGPNASGKTTLVRLLSRLLEPSAGEIRLDGIALAALSRAALAARVAVVAQDVPRGFPYSVEELVLMGRFPHGRARFFESERDRAAARAAMARVGVAELAARPLEALSGGERQRVMLARALAQEPRVLVLDEPTAHLDLRHQVECARLLRALNRRDGLTVILVSHDLDLAGELCDRLLLVAAGEVAGWGTPAEILAPALLERAYGCALDVTPAAEGSPPRVRPKWSSAAETRDADREGRWERTVHGA